MGEAEKYDVFINHRGPDTKNTIASLIYGRLQGHGLRIFLDKEDLEAGDAIDDKIKSAISSSSVHVAIFSVKYAESSWCLNELLGMVDMLQSGCKIIPIFYDIEPQYLRHIEEGPYAAAFLKHGRRYEVELVQKWKDALKKASLISGRKFNTTKDNLANLEEEIVEKVLKEAKWKPLQVADHPVGLHQAAEDFKNFLKKRQLNGTTVVGIVGLRGSGKSTLVTFLYNFYLQSGKFKRYCFLSDLNELNDRRDLAALQQQMVRDLLGDGKCNINNTTEGETKLRQRLNRCGPFLIVFDGLDKEEQIELLLLPVKDVLKDSLILVTCRDKTLLARNKMNLFYHVELLQGKDARDLFCWYAFERPKPLEDLEDLVEKFLEICCGFPLALKVLGQKLSLEKNLYYWEEQLEELQSPENIVDELLKDSYKHLQDTEREVFLDVAHFLVEENKDLAVRVLQGLPELRVKVLTCLLELQRKCLLWEEIEHCERRFAKGPSIHWRSEGSTKIRMYDLVRKMARRIASQDSCPSSATKPLRLYQWNDKSILQQLQCLDNPDKHVRGIRWEYIDNPERQDRDMLQLPEMDNPEMTDEKIYGLRLLVLQDFRVPVHFNCLSGDLIWLRMHKSNWGNTIPSALSPQNLRVLEIDGVKLEALGDKFPCELTVDDCGESAVIPKSNIPSSSRVDKNFIEASSSASGSVWDWSRFRELTNLVQMVFKNVKGLKSLPVDFKALPNLRHLDLSGWSDLEKMPDSFTGLSQLQYLALQDCKSLSISDLGGITKLEYLDFEGCSLLRKLPDKTTAQQGLRYLNLMGTRIQELPQDFGKLAKMEQLLIKSPLSSFHDLDQVRILRLSHSRSLREVQSLPCNLRRLYLMNCPLLTTLPCLSNLACIRILYISGCHNLEALNLEGLRSIKEVSAKECWKLQSIHGLANLACIRILDISGCHNLEALNLEDLRSIEEILAKECWKLQSIQGLAHLHALSNLNVSTFNEVPNSTIWSEILGLPSNASTVILGGANVLCKNAEEMDSVKKSISKEFQDAIIEDILPKENSHQVQLRNIELHAAILLCFIAKKNFIDFKLSVGDNVYSIRKPFTTGLKVHQEHEETPRIYIFMWSQNSNLFRDLTLHGKSVLDCTIELCHSHCGTLNASLTAAWIVIIKKITDGVKICKHLLNSLCFHTHASSPP